MTIWAIDARYPGDNPEITDQEVRDALQLAEAVVGAAREELREKRQPSGNRSTD